MAPSRQPVDLQQATLVSELLAAHTATTEHAASLAAARQRRRYIAEQLHTAGHTYRWIGEQIGVSAQAVEGFIKYPRRNKRAPRT